MGEFAGWLSLTRNAAAASAVLIAFSRSEGTYLATKTSLLMTALIILLAYV